MKWAELVDWWVKSLVVFASVSLLKFVKNVYQHHKVQPLGTELGL